MRTPTAIYRDGQLYWRADGIELTPEAWARRIGISGGTLRSRVVDAGWSIERALITPARKHTDPKVKRSALGQSLTLAEWSAETGIKRATLYSRVIERGMSMTDAVSIRKYHYQSAQYKTHCINGHALIGSGADIYTSPNGDRACRPCQIAWQNKYKCAGLPAEFHAARLALSALRRHINRDMPDAN